LSREQAAVFVDRCFCHGCPKRGHTPRTNTAFWTAKIACNREREGATTQKLTESGVYVSRFWEHELRDDLAECFGAIRRALLAHAVREVPVFEKPSKEDFVRMLGSIVDEAQGQAVRKASALQGEREKAVNPGAGYTQALTGALLPIHKDCVARAMELAVSVAQRSGLSLNELCTTAEDFLKGHVPAISSLVVRAPFIAPAVQGGLAESVAMPFSRQIDDAVQAVRVGYIRERSIMNPAAETVQAKALRMLQVIYERTQSGNGGIDIEQVRGLVGLLPEDARAGWTYLTDKKLISPWRPQCRRP
jgi:hypothetical protein